MYRSSIASLSKVDLCTLAKRFGLLQTGNKPDILERIDKYLSFVSDMQFPKRLVAVDVGYVNLAYAQLEFDLNHSIMIFIVSYTCPRLETANSGHAERV
jgi:hypothetical protein